MFTKQVSGLYYASLVAMTLFPVKINTSNTDGMCVEQPNNKLLPIHAYSDDKHNTPKMCADVCSYQGYKFAGVKWAKECWCGNDEPPHDKYTSPARCNMPCSGDNTTMCGAGSTLNLYKSSKTSLLENTPLSCNN